MTTDGETSKNNRAADRLYLTAINREAVRVLGLMDRQMYSPTSGCLDRTYWAWKFTDFPGARFQEGLCVLSFLYAVPFDDNHYYREPKLLEWIARGFDFWTRIQHNDGSYDEAYPFERSLAATGFTSFYLAEAWSLLGGQLPNHTSNRFVQALVRAGQWLINNDERHGFLSNHLAAAAAALYHIFRICGAERFERRSRYFIEKILNHQSKEGWYDEYGGADPGYQSHGSFYLARYFQLSDDDRMSESLERSFSFLKHFVHADGSFGGEYASRNTQTYYPAAFEMMSKTSGTAHWMAASMLPSVESLAAAGLGSVDPYNFFPLLNNYVFAYLACLEPGHRKTVPKPPPEKTGMICFPEAGILKARMEKYDLYVGLEKGGVLKAFDRKKHRLILNDCGYIGKLSTGQLLSSQAAYKNRPLSISSHEIVIEGPFSDMKKPVLSPFTFIGFRLFTLTFGRFRRLGYWLKSFLVKVLIYRRRKLDLYFRRRIVLSGDSFLIQDHIHGPIGVDIETLHRVDLFTTIHMGSSRYFVPNELHCVPPNQHAESVIDTSQIKKGITLERTVYVE